MYKHFFKRAIDFVLALSGLIILSPVILVVTIILYRVNDGKPFFFQRRPGRKEKIFRLMKFKTMNDRKDKNGILLHDEDRLTMTGKFLRKTSLDELPQLVNVLKGDMSLVGPRPLLIEYLPYYNELHKRRHEVRPGITGLAQISGRNNMKFSERLNLDVQYVDSLSFALDARILFKTFLKVFARSGVQNGQTVDEVDDLGLTKDLTSNHFSKKLINNEH